MIHNLKSWNSLWFSFQKSGITFMRKASQNRHIFTWSLVADCAHTTKKGRYNIPSVLITLLRGINLPELLTHTVNLSDIAVGVLCFSAEHQINNRTIRDLFQADTVTTNYIIPFCSCIIENVPRRKVCNAKNIL